MSDRAKSAADYAGTPLYGNAQPENRCVAMLDAEGYVVRMNLLKPREQSEEFWKAILATRDLYPLDPADVVLPHPLWPIDEDGRGLSVLEVERQQHLTTTTNARAA